MHAREEVLYDRFNPYPWYRRMRETCPVHYHEQMKMWYVYRYQDCHRILSDPQAFSSMEPQIHTYLGASFFRMDPPRHARYRALVSRAFTSRSVAALEPRIVAIVTQLLDAVSPAGQMDVIADLAFPLPATVIMELFGIPLAHREHFRQLSEHIAEEIVTAPMGVRRVSEDNMASFLLPLIEARRQAPADDMISRLSTAEVEGERLTTHDIQATCILMLVAGHETTTRLIGNAMFCFLQNPAALAELQASPELIPGALEEVLRYRPSVSAAWRISTADTMIGSEMIKAGQPVVVQISSANHDETEFADPDRFDILRKPNRHLSLGQGIHFCLGAPLARLEARIAFELLLQRCADLRPLAGVPAQMEMSLGDVFQSVAQLPITFVPGAGSNLQPTAM